MTTLATLRTAVSRALRDPSLVTFVAADVLDLINAGMAEIGRIAPQRFQEDLALVANAMEYQLLKVGASVPIPEIEVMRVELWDVTTTPDTPLARVLPADAEYVNYSAAGWKVWDGVLELPRWVPVHVAGSESNYLIRVWGYAPYTPLVTDSDVVGLSNEREEALKVYCLLESLRRLNADRSLFAQWQTRSGNTDVSPAALMNGLAVAQAEWNRKARQMTVLREAP